MARLALPALRIVLLVAAALGVVLLFETRLIYFPTREHEVTPKGLGLPFEDLRLDTEDGVRIHAWHLPVEGSRHTVVVSHGNAGNISHRLDRALLMQTKLGVSVLLYDYRGYGRSEGRPDEAGTYRDARAVWRFLAEDRAVPPERLVLFGESLGSAVALDLALVRPCRALVLEAPFTSVPDMARAVLPFAPMGALLRTRYDNLAKIGSLRVPLLVLHGERDSVVPLAQGLRLFEAAPQPKRFYRIAGADHNDTYIVGGEAYWRELAAFLGGLE